MYIITSSTDNKNIGHIIDSLPQTGDVIELEQKYNFRIDYIKEYNDEYILSNANYILKIKKI
jgi:hypothetical protein